MCWIRPLTACTAVLQFVCIPASYARVCCIRSPQTAACPCDQEACRREPTCLTEAPYEDTKMKAYIWQGDDWGTSGNKLSYAKSVLSVSCGPNQGAGRCLNICNFCYFVNLILSLPSSSLCAGVHLGHSLLVHGRHVCRPSLGAQVRNGDGDEHSSYWFWNLSFSRSCLFFLM